MLTNPIALSLYNRFSQSPQGFTGNNMSLAAKCALMVYRKAGKQEARAFIDGIRLIVTFDEMNQSLEDD